MYVYIYMSLQASQRTSDWTVCKYEPTQVGSQDEFWIKSNLFSGEPLLGRTWIHEHWMIHLTFAGPWVEFLSHGLRRSENPKTWRVELSWGVRKPLLSPSRPSISESLYHTAVSTHWAQPRWNWAPPWQPGQENAFCVKIPPWPF